MEINITNLTINIYWPPNDGCNEDQFFTLTVHVNIIHVIVCSTLKQWESLVSATVNRMQQSYYKGYFNMIDMADTM